MKISVSAASGVESVTKRELFKLGVENAPAINGRMTFEGDDRLLAYCNLWLSTASRVFVVLSQFKCADFDTLFDGVSDIKWEDYIPDDGRIVIKPKLVQSKLNAFSATQSVAKKAICERLKRVYKRDFLAENGKTFEIEIGITRDFCSVLLNASGESLHRRGYRNVYGEAQLKETLAASMLELSVWNPSRPLCDLFTGTGTIAIEAAMKEKNIAPGINRTFDFLHFKNFDKKVFEVAKSEAIGRLSQEKPLKIHAYDIDEAQLKKAFIHAKNAGVADVIEFHNESMENFKSDLLRGVAFANPPYGERLDERPFIEKLYRAYGKVRKANPDWCFYTITPVSDFERLFCQRADKKRKLYNGRIECCFYAHLGKPQSKS